MGYSFQLAARDILYAPQWAASNLLYAPLQTPVVEHMLLTASIVISQVMWNGRIDCVRNFINCSVNKLDVGVFFYKYKLLVNKGKFRVKNRTIPQFSAFVKNGKLHDFLCDNRNFRYIPCGKKPVILQWTHHLYTNRRQNGNFSDLHIQFRTQLINENIVKKPNLKINK